MRVFLCLFLGVPFQVGQSLQVRAPLHFAVGYPFFPSRGAPKTKSVVTLI